MARDEAGRERNTDESALKHRENELKLLDRREYMKLAGASVAALGGVGLGSSSAAAVSEGGPSNPDNWELAFEDDFDGDSLDTSKWEIGYGWGRETNTGAESISPDNVRVENSLLRLQGTHDGRDVQSGAVNTKQTFTQGPGSYWEAKLRPARRVGFHPGFWSKPASEQWPPEIDFFELFPTEGDYDDWHTSHHNVHYSASTRSGDSSTHNTLPLHNETDTDFTADFHVYGCAWFEDRVEMYVDGEHVGTHDDPTAMQSLRAGAPFYMMLNMHIDSIAEPDYSEEWGETLDVDWVRVWELSDSGSSTDGDETSDLPNTLSVTGDGSSSASYRFSVTDTIRKSEARNGSISPEDTIDDGVVEGIVAGGVDSYEFAGEISEFSIDGSATVYLNGDAVDPSSFGTDSTTNPDTPDDSGSDLPNLVVVDGSDTPNRVTTYTFDVTGDVEKDAEHGSVNTYDEISDGTVTGRVIDVKDAFRFSGDITRFEIDGAAYISVEDNDSASN